MRQECYELGKLFIKFPRLMLKEAMKNSNKYTKHLNTENIIKELDKEIQELNKQHNENIKKTSKHSKLLR